MSEAPKTTPKSDTFFGFGKFKTIKFITCQSGWQLYIALQEMIDRKWYSTIDGQFMEPLTRAQYKSIIKSIPGDPHPTCRCKDCRYHRVVKK